MQRYSFWVLYCHVPSVFSGAHGQQDVGVGIAAVGVVDGSVGAHTVADELSLDELGQ